MEQNDNRLTKDAISDHRFWNLSLKISDSALDIALRSTVEDNSLIFGARNPLARFSFRLKSGRIS